MNTEEDDEFERIERESKWRNDKNTPQWISEQEAKYLFDNHLISEDNGEPATGWRKRKVQNVQRAS